MEFKVIKGYEGFYEISEHGGVFSHYKDRTGKLQSMKKEMKLVVGGNGYLYVTLVKNHIKQVYTVHRLVAIAFIANPLSLPCVLHIDNNKQNNNYHNLKWGTYSTNTQEAYRDKLKIGMKGEKHPLAKLTNEKAREIIKMYATGRYTQLLLANKFQIDQSIISEIVNKKIWTHV